MVQLDGRSTEGARTWLARGAVMLECEGRTVRPWGRVRVNQETLPCPFLPPARCTVLEALARTETQALHLGKSSDLAKL